MKIFIFAFVVLYICIYFVDICFNCVIPYVSIKVSLFEEANTFFIIFYNTQFPDELLKDSTGVVRVLRNELQSCCEDGNDIGLYVMADTAYGSCCVDEVGASHINADCVIHYGHTCLSPWVFFGNCLYSCMIYLWYKYNMRLVRVCSIFKLHRFHMGQKKTDKK